MFRYDTQKEKEEVQLGKPGMSNSFYIVSHIQGTLILSGPGQWNINHTFNPRDILI